MALAVQKHLQITNMIILDNFGFKNCLKKLIPGDVQAQVIQVPVGRLPWWSGWSWLSGNTFKLPIWSYLTSLVSKTISKNQSLGLSGLRSYRKLLDAPDYQDGPGCPETLSKCNIIMIDNFCFKNCLKNSIPTNVRVQVLQEPVRCSHGDQDGPGCPENL